MNRHPGPAPLKAASSGGRFHRQLLGSMLAVVGLPLLVFSLLSAWGTHRDQRQALEQLQRAQAQSAALQIGHFLEQLESQLRWTVSLPWSAATDIDRQLDAARVLRHAPSIMDLSLIDGSGTERLHVARLHLNRPEAAADRSADPAFRQARAAGRYHGPVYFHRETEPFMALAVAGVQPDFGVGIAQINLKHAWEIVAGIRIGESGYAYVTDRQGRLIAHPDISLVLRNTDLSAHIPAPPPAGLRSGTNLRGEAVWRTVEPIPATGWNVVVELPAAEANRPLVNTLVRGLTVTALGLLLAAVLALVLARQLVRPVQDLTTGARRIGDGQLEHRIAVEGPQELQALAAQFNDMAARLGQSYAGLETTVRERTRELALSNQQMSRFIAAASHDLRQPLHALNLLVAQLQHTTDASQRRQLVARIDAALGGINQLFDGLLDISRLDAGGIEPDRRDFPIQWVLDRVQDTHADDARAQGTRLRVRPCGAWVRSDPALLERIVANLLGNALRHAQGRTVRVGCRRSGDELLLLVADNGPGIAPQQQPLIFNEFYQLAPAGAAPHKGLGLGLAIVQRLCKLLGHELRLRSMPGRGTRFGIRLPVATAVPTEEAPSPISATDSAVPGGWTVLLLEDEAAVRQSTTDLLRAWGCRVCAAQSRAEGLRLLGGARPDLVISDFHLGGAEDGCAAVSALRGQFGSGLPALIITGDLAPAVREAVAALPAELLHKPVRAMNLRALLNSLLTRPPDPSRGV